MAVSEAGGFYEVKSGERLVSFALIMFIALASANFAYAQSLTSNCSLQSHLTLHDGNQSCQNASWGGFINHGCCGVMFNDYLYVLTERANRTGRIFQTPTEQKNCLASMNANETKVVECGIEKLASGGGGCSSYSVKDVATQLGGGLDSLRQDCELLGQGGSSNQTCRSCLTRWQQTGKSFGNNMEKTSIEADLCQFAVLITLTSTRFKNKNWVQAVYKCLDQRGSKESGGIKFKLGFWILIAGLVGIAVVIAITTWTLCKRRVTVSSPKEKEDPLDVLSEDYGGLQLSIKEVYTATKNLNPVNFIGQGIAGKVYRGVLSNGQHVAVKHIISEGHVDTYVREVTSLLDVRHPNLVSLLGYCENEDECFLVYELCHNGNLSEWLFGKDKTLSWIQRLEIAIDGARALWFLHTYPEGCIVHRDIKPTNILIGANFEAKLSDFGLSKVMDVGQSFVSSEVRGTFGYVDPEYRRNRRVNASGDVYSFGIVLLQLLSGKKVINLNLNKPMPLSRMARVLTKGGNTAEFADPRLNGQYLDEAFDLVLKLALSCTGVKQQRPSMEQVVLKLEKALVISSEDKSAAVHSTTQE